MESAMLNREIVRIEQERAVLVRRGLTPEAAREALEAKYRTYSREKGAFACACCGTRVVMVLYADRAVFRHYDSEACAGERNFAVYSAGLEKAAEARSRHEAGKDALLRALQTMQLAGEYRFEEGYLHRKELRFVPDFIVTLPDGSQWAIDFVPLLRGDAAYRKRRRNRLMSYLSAGFKPLFLIDRSWLSVADSAYISVNPAELDMRTPPNPYDAMWRKALAAPPLSLTEPVRSLVYLDPEEENAVLARFQTSGERWGRLLFEPAAMPLDRLLSLDAGRPPSEGPAMLQLFMKGERDRIAPYRDALLKRLQEEEREQAEEAARREAQAERMRRLREESLPAQEAAAPDANKPVRSGHAETALKDGLAELTGLLERCKRSPRLADYPALDDHLNRAEVLIEFASTGQDGAAESYRSAWSILRNVSYPLLGE